MSSLSRAFTTIKNRSKSDAGAASSLPQRSLTTKHVFPSGTIRYKISAPVELLSTTNMLSYNAPDIYPTARSRSGSGSESDSSSPSPANASTPLTSPDTSSIESSPSSPRPNQLSCYFGTASGQTAPAVEAPKIPTRIPSHTKRSAEVIARKRSTSRMSSPKNSTSTARSSINMFSANVETVEKHPFGNELAQVSELAEEYGISSKMEVIDEEEQELFSKGLFKFRAEDYAREIHGLFLNAFGEIKPSMAWI
jgi:hypothetical protein